MAYFSVDVAVRRVLFERNGETLREALKQQFPLPPVQFDALQARSVITGLERALAASSERIDVLESALSEAQNKAEPNERAKAKFKVLCAKSAARGRAMRRKKGRK